jgi:hypothetical protein
MDVGQILVVYSCTLPSWEAAVFLVSILIN